MKRKVGFIVLVLLVLMSISAYAQNVSLREGYYQTQGSADHVYVAPRRTFNGQGTNPQTAFERSVRNDTYGIMAWIGMPESANLLYAGTGNIVGNELRINVERLRQGNVDRAGLSGLISQGTLTIWQVVDNQTFLDVAGQRWIWRRQS